MCKKRFVFLFSITLLLTASAGIEAQGEAAESAVSFSASVTLTSDYVWRGVSQSNEDPAIQGGFEVDIKGFYFGTWGSNVDFAEVSADSADMELDGYLGYRRDFGKDASFDLGLIEYSYPGSGADLDWLESYLSFGWRQFGFGINYSDDVLATDSDALFLVLSYSQDLGGGFELAADVGQYSLDSDVWALDSYITWSAGLSWSEGPTSIGMTYMATDSDGEILFGDWAGDRVVLSLTASM